MIKVDEAFRTCVLKRCLINKKCVYIFFTLKSKSKIKLNDGSDECTIFQFKARNQMWVFQQIVFFSVVFLVFSNIVTADVNDFKNWRRIGKLVFQLVDNLFNRIVHCQKEIRSLIFQVKYQ